MLIAVWKNAFTFASFFYYTNFSCVLNTLRCYAYYSVDLLCVLNSMHGGVKWISSKVGSFVKGWFNFSMYTNPYRTSFTCTKRVIVIETKCKKAAGDTKKRNSTELTFFLFCYASFKYNHFRWPYIYIGFGVKKKVRIRLDENPGCSNVQCCTWLWIKGEELPFIDIS